MNTTSLISAIRWMLLLSVAAVRFCCSAQSTPAANGHTPSFSASLAPFRATAQEVTLIVSVTGHRGRFDSTLALTDLRILDNGVPPKRITYFDCVTNVTLRIAIVMDISDSVAYAFSLEKRSAERLVKKDLRDPDLALVIGFNEQPHLLRGPTSNYHQLSKAIKAVPGGGNTSLYDAVAFAAQELEKITDNGYARRVIILITDGQDNSSQLSLKDAVEAADETESVVYILNAGQPFSAEASSAMNELAGLTGGKILGTLDETGIPFFKIKEDLRNQYAIGYMPANNKPDGVFHKIDVRVSKKLTLHYKRGYFAR